MTTTEAETTYQVFISDAEYADTKAKINKINARAAKKGLAGRIVLNAERQSKTSTSVSGLSVTRTGWLVSLGGTAPSFGGWTFLARVDVEDGGLVVNTAPGVEGIDRSVLVAGACDHCHTNRPRNATYVLRHEDGRQVQVGSTCIKDFLGWQGGICFEPEAKIVEDLGWGNFALGSGSFDFDVLTVLRASWAATEALGYRRAGDLGTSTAAMARMAIQGPSRWDEKDARLMADYSKVVALVPQSDAKAVEVRDWILSDEFAGNNEYVRNLKVIASGETVSPKNFNLLASAPQAWIRANEVKVERAARPVSNHVGTVGDKVEVTVTVKAIRYIDSQYGVTTLYMMSDAEGNVFKWFASNPVLGREEDVTFTLKGTIKAHDEWQGVKSTILTRCKEVSA